MRFEEYLSSLQNKTVAVIGIGVSNRPLVELLLSRGVAVTACDKKDRAALGPLAEELEGKQSIESLRELYGSYYAGSTVVELRPADAPTCGFIGSNNLAGRDILQIFVNGNEEQLLLSARLDNLGKGASGAAVQNMNLMLGFEETRGLNL